MALPDPENTEIDHARLDSGIHARDSERAPASGWQIFIAGLLVVTIVVVFFYGLTSQRTEVADGVGVNIAGAQAPQANVASPLGAGQQTANAPSANTPKAAPAVNQAPPPITTGSAPRR